MLHGSFGNANNRVEALLKHEHYSTYEGKRIFITGHTGFKGTWLCTWLKLLGARVTGYALAPPTTPSMFQLLNADNGIDSIHGDVRDADRLKNAIRNAETEIVFHLAAQSLVRVSYSQPLETFSSNVMGTATVLEAVRQCPTVKAVIVVTSDKCYRNQNWVWGYRESDELGGDDPYACSKACAEMVTKAYVKSYFSDTAGEAHPASIATVRAGNVIGGGDFADDRLVPDMVKAFSAGQKVTLRNPNATRPWQHVLEPLDGYLKLGSKLLNGERAFQGAWNFGPSLEEGVRTVAWLADQFSMLWGEGAGWCRDNGEHPPESNALSLTSAKAGSELRWHPRLSVMSALEWSMTWYRSYLSVPDELTLLTKQQIDAFMDLSREH